MAKNRRADADRLPISQRIDLGFAEELETHRNGTLKCVSFQCVVDPVTVVACNPQGDTACVKNKCDPETGQCVPTEVPNGTVCNDQNACSAPDSCQNGVCAAGTPPNCSRPACWAGA